MFIFADATCAYAWIEIQTLTTGNKKSTMQLARMRGLKWKGIERKQKDVFDATCAYAWIEISEELLTYSDKRMQLARMRGLK